MTADANDCAKRNTHKRSLEDINKVCSFLQVSAIKLHSNYPVILTVHTVLVIIHWVIYLHTTYSYFNVIYDCVRYWKHGKRHQATILDWM